MVLDAHQVVRPVIILAQWSEDATVQKGPQGRRRPELDRIGLRPVFLQGPVQRVYTEEFVE